MRFVWKFATSVAMVLVLIGGMIVRHREEQRIESLRAERQRIDSELQQVKAIADEAHPSVVLEKDGTRVIVDLHQTTSYY